MMNSTVLSDPFLLAVSAMQIVVNPKISYPDRIGAVQELSILASNGRTGLDAVFAVMDEKRLNGLKHRDKPELLAEICFLQDLVKDRIDEYMIENLPRAFETVISNEQISWLNNITAALKMPPKWKIEQEGGTVPRAVLNVSNSRAKEFLNNLLNRRGISSELQSEGPIETAAGSETANTMNVCSISINGLKLQNLTIEVYDDLVEIIRVIQLRSELNKSANVIFSSRTGAVSIVQYWNFNEPNENFRDYLSLRSDNVVALESYSQALDWVGIQHILEVDNFGLSGLKIPFNYFPTVTKQSISNLTDLYIDTSGKPYIKRLYAPLLMLGRGEINMQSSAPNIDVHRP